MTHVLYLQASPRQERSVSCAIGDAFIDELSFQNPEVEIRTRNLFDIPPPPFDRDAVEGKYAIIYGKEKSPAAAASFRRVLDVVEEWVWAHVYVLAVPMWNFGIPWVLKQYLDCVIQPTYTFAVTDEGYKGLLENRKAILALARGGAYADYPEMDFQERYLKTVLGFMGIADVNTVLLEGTLQKSAEETEQALKAAQKQARTLAKTLAS